MVLSDVLGPIRRRWYILLVGLILAATAGWATALAAPAQYTARGLVILLPSSVATGPNGNPLLNLGGLDLPTRVLIAYYASEPVKDDLQRRAPKADVVVSVEESTRGPIIAVDVKDSTPDGALNVLSYVVDSIPETLARIQAEVGTSKSAAVRSMPLVLDTVAEPDRSVTIRLVVAATVAMLALTFFALFFVDGILVGRTAAKRSRANATDDALDADAGIEPDSDTGTESVSQHDGQDPNHAESDVLCQEVFNAGSEPAGGPAEAVDRPVEADAPPLEIDDREPDAVTARAEPDMHESGAEEPCDKQGPDAIESSAHAISARA